MMGSAHLGPPRRTMQGEEDINRDSTARSGFDLDSNWLSAVVAVTLPDPPDLTMLGYEMDPCI